MQRYLLCTEIKYKPVVSPQSNKRNALQIDTLKIKIDLNNKMIELPLLRYIQNSIGYINIMASKRVSVKHSANI